MLHDNFPTIGKLIYLLKVYVVNRKCMVKVMPQLLGIHTIFSTTLKWPTFENVCFSGTIKV